MGRHEGRFWISITGIGYRTLVGGISIAGIRHRTLIVGISIAWIVGRTSIAGIRHRISRRISHRTLIVRISVAGIVGRTFITGIRHRTRVVGVAITGISRRTNVRVGISIAGIVVRTIIAGISHMILTLVVRISMAGNRVLTCPAMVAVISKSGRRTVLHCRWVWLGVGRRKCHTAFLQVELRFKC